MKMVCIYKDRIKIVCKWYVYIKIEERLYENGMYV